MHVISFKMLREFILIGVNAKVAIQDWYKRVIKAEWNNFNDIRQTFNSVYQIGKHRFVFNVKGNNYRIVAIVHFKINRVYIRWIGSHKEYSRLKDLKSL